MNKEKAEDDTLYTCDNRFNGGKTDAGYFIPILVTDLVNEGESFTYTEGLCF